MNKAFIPISRDLFKDGLYYAERFSRWQAYLDLIYQAEFKAESKPLYAKGRPMRILRGQIATSQIALGILWHWDPKTVRNFLVSMKKEGRLDYESYPLKNPAMTIITLCNYDQITCQKNTEQQDILTETSASLPGDFPSEIPGEIPDEIPTSNNITSITSDKNTNNIEEELINTESKPFDVDEFCFGNR